MKEQSIFFNLNESDNSNSSLSNTMDNMSNYYAVVVDGASINKIRRIDREFRLYEEKQSAMRAK